ncbi:unnamed protein product [Rotaria magnacalcarata]
MLRRILSLYQIRYAASSILSSSKEIYLRVKKLLDSKEYQKVLNLFDQQSHLCKDIEINMALRACINLNDYQRGINIQEKLSQDSLNNSYIQTSLIRLYSLISNNMLEKVLDLFDEMKIKPNQPSTAILFSTCARLAINILMRFGDVTSAEHFFQIIKKNIITYGAMMNGYVQNNKCDKALDLFEEVPFKRNDVSYTIIFNARARISNDRATKIGRKLLGEMPKNLETNNYIQNSAIDMLMRFGGVESAEKRFQMIQKKNIITYGTMTNGYNINSEPLKNLMVHAHELDLRLCNSLIDMWRKVGSVKNAQEIFELINKTNVFTYTAMINSYARNHMGSEAVDLYRKMPNNLHDEISSICVLNEFLHAVAILSGARNSRDSILSEKMYRRMKILFPDEKGALISGSILLCNVYSSLGDHEEAEDIRFNRRKELGKKVQVGLSWTEVNGEIVQFTSHDHSHARPKEIYAEVECISSELIKHEHNYDSSWITRPLHENETIESVLCAHSERLAIAFNFIQETKPSFIQIMKNLRVCGDCHHATRLIAKIRQVEIVVRDANCIHHFSTNGTCSCQDQF